MRLGKLTLAAVTALSVASAPALAQAADPAPVRASAELENENELRGGFIIPLIAVIAIILGILVLVGDDDELPTSP
jgi:hypothetical protein